MWVKKPIFGLQGHDIGETLFSGADLGANHE